MEICPHILLNDNLCLSPSLTHYPSCCPGLTCTRLFLLSSSTTNTTSPWKPLRDVESERWEANASCGERAREESRGERETQLGQQGRHERLGCYLPYRAGACSQPPHPKTQPSPLTFPQFLIHSPHPRLCSPYALPSSLFPWPPIHTPLPIFALHPSRVQTGSSHGGDRDVHRWKHW